MRNSKNIQMLEVVATGLGDLLTEVVFIGGATTALYVVDVGAPEVRVTEDVDCVVDVVSRVKYLLLEKRLQKLGFRHCMEPDNTLICRWVFQDIFVDVMPTDEKILGFTNHWYAEGIENSLPYTLPSGQKIRIFSIPYFLGSKIEAFVGRGHGDFRMSSDIEDIVAVFDGNDTVIEAVSKAPLSVKKYLISKFKELQSNDSFIESIYAHMPYGGGGTRATEVRAKIEKISKMTL